MGKTQLTGILSNIVILDINDNVTLPFNLTVSGLAGTGGVVIADSQGLLSVSTNYYTKTELQTSGSSAVHWDNITNTPQFVPDGDKGDITVSSGGLVWTIDPAVVTYSKIQNVGANSFLANITGAPASVQEISTSRIPLFASAITGVPSSSTWLRGDGTWEILPILTPGGPQSAIQINDSGTFFGSGNLLYVEEPNPNTLEPGNNVVYLNNFFGGGRAHQIGNTVLIDMPSSLDYGNGITMLSKNLTLDVSSSGYSNSLREILTGEYGAALIITLDYGVGMFTDYTVGGTPSHIDFSLKQGIVRLGHIATLSNPNDYQVYISRNDIKIVSLKTGSTPPTTTGLTRVVITDSEGKLSFSSTELVGLTDGDKGDITVSGSGTVWTIDNSAVTYSKIQNVAANTFLANVTGSPAIVQEISTGRIPLFGSNITGTPSSTTFLRGDGSWSALGGTPLSSITAALSTNTINNAGFNQVWNWNSHSVGEAFRIYSSGTANVGQNPTTVSIENNTALNSTFNITTGLNVYNSGVNTGGGVGNKNGITVLVAGDNTANFSVSEGVGSVVYNGYTNRGGRFFSIGAANSTNTSTGIVVSATDGYTTSGITLTTTTQSVGATVYGVNSTVSGGDFNYAIYGIANATVGSSVRNYGAYLSASGASVLNYALYTDLGKIRLGDLQGTGTRMVVAAPDGELSTQAIPSGGGPSSTALSAITAAVATNDIDNLNYNQNWNWSTFNSGSALSLIGISSVPVVGTPGFFTVNYQNELGSTNNNGATGINVFNYSTGTGNNQLSRGINVVTGATGSLSGTGSRSVGINISAGGAPLVQGLYVTTTTTGVNKYAIYSENGDIRFGSLIGSGTRMVVTDSNGILSTQTIPSGGGGGGENLDQTLVIGNITQEGIIFDKTIAAPTVEGDAVSKRWFKFDNLVKTTNTDAYQRVPFNIYQAATLQYGKINEVIHFGWNMGPGGNAEISGLPAIGYSIESNFEQGSRFVESHEFYITPSGTQIRLKSYTVNTANDNVDFYHTVSRLYGKLPTDINRVWFGLQPNADGAQLVLNKDEFNYASMVYGTNGLEFAQAGLTGLNSKITTTAYSYIFTSGHDSGAGFFRFKGGDNGTVLTENFTGWSLGTVAWPWGTLFSENVGAENYAIPRYYGQKMILAPAGSFYGTSTLSNTPLRVYGEGNLTGGFPHIAIIETNGTIPARLGVFNNSHGGGAFENGILIDVTASYASIGLEGNGNFNPDLTIYNKGDQSIFIQTNSVNRIGITGSGAYYLYTALPNDDALTQVVVRDSATGQLKYRSASSLTGGGGGGGFSVTNETDNRIITSSGAGTGNAESNLTFDGTNLLVNGLARFTGSGAVFGSGTVISLGSDAYIQATSSGANNAGVLINRNTSSSYASLDFISEYNTSIGWSVQLQPSSTSLHFFDRVNNANVLSLLLGGNIQVTSLAGTGTRMVVADASGTLSTQTIPSGGGGGSITINNNGDNRVLTANGGSSSIDAESNFTYDGNYINITYSTGQFGGKFRNTSPTGYGAIGLANDEDNIALVLKAGSSYGPYKIISAQDLAIYSTTAGDIAFLNDAASGNIKFAAGGSSTSHVVINSSGGLAVASLAGTGTRMVVANASGNLSTQAIPSGGSYTFSQGLTDTSGSVTLGGNVTDDIFINGPGTLDISLVSISLSGTIGISASSSVYYTNLGNKHRFSVDSTSGSEKYIDYDLTGFTFYNSNLILPALGVASQVRKLVVDEDGVVSSVLDTGGGDITNAANLGTGEGIYASKTGSIINLKSLKQGTNITLSSTGNEITINASASGIVTADKVALGTATFWSTAYEVGAYNANGVLRVGSGSDNTLRIINIAAVLYVTQANFTANSWVQCGLINDSDYRPTHTIYWRGPISVDGTKYTNVSNTAFTGSNSYADMQLRIDSNGQVFVNISSVSTYAQLSGGNIVIVPINISYHRNPNILT